MGKENAVDNLSISNSYTGLLRLSSDGTGASGSERTVYTSDGTETCFSLGTGSATITVFNATDATITNLTAHNLTVTSEVLFTNDITLAGQTNTATVDNTATLVNNGTFTSNGIINSVGTAKFADIQCTGNAVFEGNFTFTNVLSVKSTGVTITAPLQVSAAASFSDITTNNISSATNTGSITVKSPIILNGALTTTSTSTLGGAQLNINASNTKLDTKLTCASNTEIDLQTAKSVLTATPPLDDSSNLVATTEFVQRSIGGGGNMVPDYRNAFVITIVRTDVDTSFTAPANGYVLFSSVYNVIEYRIKINSIQFAKGNSGKYGLQTICLPIAIDDIVTFYGMSWACFIPSK